jgi:subtilisin family serine protease
MHKSVPLLFLSAAALFAQEQGPAPMIVVLREAVSLDLYARQYRHDPRQAANPRAWEYLDKAVLAATQRLEQNVGFKADQVFSHTVKGFAARLTPQQIRRLQADGLVETIEPDAPVQAFAQTLPWGVDRVDADISSVKAGDGSGTAPVNAYVIDSGIEASHADLSVVRFVNFVDTNGSDCNGHGTHVAGSVAARDNSTGVVGVAPGATLTALKVLNCSGSGSMSGVIKAVDWVTANAVRPAVVNMSLGGPASPTLDRAVKRSADRGIFYAVAAGNSGANACNYSPARAGTHNGVMTVAATDWNEAEASWSNYGSCVDIWAPGVSIISTYPGGYATASGTSMASPHVAGAGALYLRLNGNASAATVESSIKSMGWFTGTRSKDGRNILRLNVAGY